MGINFNQNHLYFQYLFQKNQAKLKNDFSKVFPWIFIAH